MRSARWRKLAIGVAVFGGLVVAWLWLRQSGIVTRLTDAQAVRELVVALGPWGPVGIVGLLALAIVFSPLPSAPVALVSGALYGHTWGTVYVAAGSELGALIAFALARSLGRDWVGGLVDSMALSWLTGSQNRLMAAVFVSRLLPFVSFDVISYAAGLTRLTWWRFAVATLAGIFPASFVLAHTGAEAVNGESGRIAVAVGLLGVLTVGSAIAGYLLRR